MSITSTRDFTHRAGPLQGVLLLLPITMAVMGLVVLSPVLPRMQAHFASVPGAAYLVPMVLTAPALCIALLSPIAGAVVDFFGRRRTLIVALLIYAGLGVLPIFLSSLAAIIASRALLGAMEAVIVTSSTTLIGDYFDGAQREKWLAYQTALATVAATVLFAVGGVLGNISWRAPFAVYTVSLFFAVGLILWTWEPKNPEEESTAEASTVAFPWRVLAPMCLIAAFGGVMFFTMQIQLGPLLGRYYGVHVPGTVGLLIAIGSASLLVGSIVYRRLARARVAVQLLLAFALIGGGFALMRVAASTSQLMIYVVINQFGCGVLLPAMVVWTMGWLPFEVRGRGTGLFMSGWWIGQFLGPQVVALLDHRLGGLPAALQVLGYLSLGGAALAALTLVRRTERPPAVERV
jgi:MFS family permease